MFLSILVPSKRPEGLERFLQSLRTNTSNLSDIEVIVLVDDDDHPEYVDYLGNVTTIHQHSVKPVHVGNLFHECYKLSSGEWILFANDDVRIDTFDWDKILRAKIAEYPDQLALFWPNDKKFGANLSCFPIVSRKVLEGIDFFPTPYRRYKVDDTIYSVFPYNRRIYLPEITFVHSNPIYTRLVGNEVPDADGAVMHDNTTWVLHAQERENMKGFFKSVRGEVKVLIGASTGDVPRRADFFDYLDILEKPIGSIIMRSHERSPAAARNIIFQQALDYGCSHVLLVDDDQAFQPNALMLLLQHDVDIVSGLYFQRAWPHRPLIFDLAHENGECRYFSMNGNKQRLVPIVAAGFGFLLLKVDILAKLEKPWVRLGELNPEEWCDDIGFFNRVRKVGIKSYCDLQCKIGHMGTMIIWPNEVDGEWFAGYDTGPGAVNVPLPKGE
jgi:hypothetical protein